VQIPSAFSLWHDVVAVFDQLELDYSCRVVILTGAGARHFCGGADLRDPVLMSEAAEALPKRDFITVIVQSRHAELFATPQIRELSAALAHVVGDVKQRCHFSDDADDFLHCGQEHY
jgi:Enoyl-CoA hydratase/isomerase